MVCTCIELPYGPDKDVILTFMCSFTISVEKRQSTGWQRKEHKSVDKSSAARKCFPIVLSFSLQLLLKRGLLFRCLGLKVCCAHRKMGTTGVKFE